MINKKAATLWNNVLNAVIIVLVFVVVVLIATGAFAGTGEWWSNFWGRKGDNLAAVGSGCEVACQGHLEPDWCNPTRPVRFDNDKNNPDNRKWSCEELARKNKIEGLATFKMDNCATLICGSTIKDCEALTPDFCIGDPKCRVLWMNTASMQERLANEVGADKRWKEIEAISTGYISRSNIENHPGETCVKAVEN